MIPKKVSFPSQELETARKAVGEMEQIIRKYKIKGGVKVLFTFTEFDPVSSDRSQLSNGNVQLIEQTEQQNPTFTSSATEDCPPICYEDRINDCYHCVIPNC